MDHLSGEQSIEPEAERPEMEPLTAEEMEAFLARARAQGRTLTPEERTRIFGSQPPGQQAPARPAPSDPEALPEMAPAPLELTQIEALVQNFFPELNEALPPVRLIQGIIFDFDDTLVYLTQPLDELMAAGAQAAEAYMRSTGMDLPADFWPNIVEARRFAQEKSEEENEEHLADDAMSFLLQFFGYPASKMDPAVLAHAVDLFYAPEMSAWRLHPDALSTIQTLHQAGYKLALLANYNCDRAFQRSVDYLGLRPYFDLCLSSASVEYRKPDVRFFNLALERWGALPYEIVVVGDSLRHDIQGGLELGALTIQVELALAPQTVHDNRQLAAQIQPDAILHNLADLPQQIHEWAT